VAKYFTNSVREDGLLALARSGVVYAPGGAGTEQEIFTDAAQNTNTLYEVRSPMVFLGREFFETEAPDLVRAVRRQAERFGWAELVTVVDDHAAAVAFVLAHDPDGAGATVPWPASTAPPVTEAPLRLAALAAELIDDLARPTRPRGTGAGTWPRSTGSGQRAAPTADRPSRRRDLDLLTIDPAAVTSIRRSTPHARRKASSALRHADVAAFVASAVR
jgi:hypothetical protein